jgi:hypothetical protein
MANGNEMNSETVDLADVVNTNVKTDLINDSCY